MAPRGSEASDTQTGPEASWFISLSCANDGTTILVTEVVDRKRKVNRQRLVCRDRRQCASKCHKKGQAKAL